MSLYICAALFLTLLPALACAAPAADAPVIKPEGPIHDWLISRAFENAAPDKAKNSRGGFDIDHLGGEAKAKLVAGADGVRKAAAAGKQGIIDFRTAYPDSDNKLVYAFTTITASRPLEAKFYFGSDDGAKVWLNGKLAHEAFPEGGRALVARQDKFSAKLKAGANTLLVKVVNGTGDWKLAVEVYSAAKAKAIEAELARQQKVRDFQEQTVASANSLYVFNSFWNGIPRVIWRDADSVRKLIGSAPLKVRWFNTDLQEVEKPNAPGRYAAVVDSKMADGTPVRRALTFYSAPIELDLFYADKVVPSYPGKPVDRQAFDERADIIKRSPYLLYTTTEEGAILMAALAEAKPLGRPAGVLESPEVINDDFHLRLKMKLEGAKPAASLRNNSREKTGVMLHEGAPDEAGANADAKQKIDAVCRKWASDSGEPFTILVARNGVIITHEAFGKKQDGAPVDLGYRTDVMSITKAVTGVMFSRFLDQGLVKLDDPVGKVLPGFPTSGDKKLTYRSLFTHTNGLSGHGNWGGIHNPYLENVILDGMDGITPGVAHVYNGMGYDLAGKAVERLSGKSIVRLFQEELFHPLGVGDVPMLDLAYGAQMTAYQLGVIGQWMANRGDYGGRVTISEETFEKLLPVQLKKYWPEVDVEWGIGLTYFRDLRAGTPAGQEPKLILGPRVIGHGSASACILRVDLDRGLVVAQIRRTAGPKYEQYYTEFLTTIADSLK